ncbi:MAG: response regulator [Bacteroidales bacterium]|nr:response regulator [Bacteroidales bacterium]
MRNRILVVEDEKYNFTLLKYIFEKEGQEIVWAHNGEEAVALFRDEGRFDLILMDIKMPVMNGFEATRLIRESGSDIPVIAVTAYAMPDDRERCLAAGCNDVITKPLQRDAIVSLVSKWITL